MLFHRFFHACGDECGEGVYVAVDAEVDSIVAIARERAGFEQTSSDAGPEKLSIPFAMGCADQCSGIGAGQDFLHCRFDSLKCLPVPPRREGVAALAVGKMIVGVPFSRAHTLDQLRCDAVAFN